MTAAAEHKVPRGRRSHRLWQELVDSANAMLTIDSARQFGLITGGPEINHSRCYQILDDGAKRGFLPSPDAVEKFLEAIQQRSP